MRIDEVSHGVFFVSHRVHRGHRVFSFLIIRKKLCVLCELCVKQRKLRVLRELCVKPKQKAQK
jgi:hypothetical protein